MTTTYTPGPWTISRAVTGYVNAIEAPTGAICYGTIEEANARLIAAAPALHAALSRVSEFLEANYRTEDMPDILIPVREALAQAEGRQYTPPPIVPTDQWTPEELDAIAARGPGEAREFNRIPPADVSATPARVSRWKCPSCGSPKVQIGLPAWHREYGIDDQAGELEYVETDAAADVMWWWCEDCHETEGGLPELNEAQP